MSRFLAGGLADQTTWVLTPTPVPQRAMQMGWWFDDLKNNADGYLSALRAPVCCIICKISFSGPFQTVFTQTTSTQQTQPWNLFPVLNYPSSCSLSTCCAADFQLASVPCRRTQSVAVMSVIRDTTNWKIEHIIMQNIYTIYRHTVVKASLSDLSPLRLRFCWV